MPSYWWLWLWMREERNGGTMTKFEKWMLAAVIVILFSASVAVAGWQFTVAVLFTLLICAGAVVVLSGKEKG